MPSLRPLLPLTAVLLGAAAGLGAFTFGYAKGYSYLTNDPAACANCHLMDEHYGAWLKSSHRAAAVCNDCHAPHDPVGKWTVKARNGFWHSFYFTTGGFRDPLRITLPNHEVTERACRDCHEGMAAFIDHGAEPLTCTRCHARVGHWVR